MPSDPNPKNYGQTAAFVAFILMLLYLLLFMSISPAKATSSIEYELCYIIPGCEAYAYSDEEIALLLLRRWEGFSHGSYYDINANRNGWGTKSEEPQEVVSLKEANRRSLAAFTSVRKGIEKRYPALTEWQQLVLSVMDYNVSTFGPKLERAIASGQPEQIAEVMQLYVKANGKPLEGLRLRRASEAKLLLAAPHERQRLATALQQTVNEHIRNA